MAAVNPAMVPNFNPRFPRGKRLPYIDAFENNENFNPRFPRGKRLYLLSITDPSILFQSTLPAREATKKTQKESSAVTKFQSTLPAREATHRGHAYRRMDEVFQSTLPAREATPEGPGSRSEDPISIHASREGSDRSTLTAARAHWISIHASREGSDIKP